MDSKYAKSEHKGMSTWVRIDLKDKYKESHICYECKNYDPNGRNCALFRYWKEVCEGHHIIAPIWECAVFEPKMGRLPDEKDTDC